MILTDEDRALATDIAKANPRIGINPRIRKQAIEVLAGGNIPTVRWAGIIEEAKRIARARLMEDLVEDAVTLTKAQS